MKHNFCEHTPLDSQRKILSLEGIFGMDMIKTWKLFVTDDNYVLEI
jgi:hypothetical protein